MTEEYYNKKYKNKTVEQLCNEWRKYYIDKFKQWNDDITIENIKKIKNEEIINLALADLLEDIKNHE